MNDTNNMSIIDILNDTNNMSIINSPCDPARTPRAQIEAAVASLPPCPCKQHPHELRPVGKQHTVLCTLNTNQNRVEFAASYKRCSRCGHSQQTTMLELTAVQSVLIAAAQTSRPSSTEKAGRCRPDWGALTSIQIRACANSLTDGSHSWVSFVVHAPMRCSPWYPPT